MTDSTLEKLAALVAEKILDRLDSRALPLRSKGDQCDTTKREEQYASIKTKEEGRGGYKSPEQIAHELLTRPTRRSKRKK